MSFDIIEKLKDTPNDGSLYLIERLSEITGFFATDGKLIYMMSNNEKCRPECIDTEWITLRTNMSLVAVSNYPNFEDGYYNLILFKGNIEDAGLSAFIRLCTVHSQNAIDLGFYSFFHSLVDLFQLPKEQQYKNLLGLYGELKFIEQIYLKYKKSIVDYWHSGGHFSKYDFVCKNSNLEIKTTMADEIRATIKHSQIFNDDNNFLVLILVKHNNSGETLNMLINRLRSNDVFSTNYNFQLNIEKELGYISKSDADSKLLKLSDIRIYDVQNIPIIDNIPDCISNVNYMYNFTGIESIEMNCDLFE